MVTSWAVHEALGADFGDQRLNHRMGMVLSALGTHPNASIPAACGGRAEMHAAYRFFDNDRVTFDGILAPHVERTIQRISAQETVLLVQDTTEIDLSRPTRAVSGAGDLDGVRRGVLLHDMQAFTTQGTPLGTVWAQVINRTQQSSDGPAKHPRKRRPIEEKESLRWLNGIRRGRELAARLPHVHCIGIADSEGDIYECFAEPLVEIGGPKPGRFDWIVRGCYDRALRDEQADSLRQTVLETKRLYKAEVEVRARRAKIDREQRSRRKPRSQRRARVEIHAATVTLRPPARHDRVLPPVTVNVVLVREPHPPTGEEAVEWVLLTTLPIGTIRQVRAVVEYYCKRWGIEVFFKTLKSGCRVEQRRFEHVQRTLASLAIYLIVAWRTLFICRLGRERPEADCELILEPSEWKAVWVATHRSQPPSAKPILQTMIHLIGQMGGYVESPRREPGAQSIWIGLQRMHDLAWAWDTFGPGAGKTSRIV